MVKVLLLVLAAAVGLLAPAAARADTAALQGRGMWIWHLERSEGGDLAAIVARARAHAIKTVFVKSADGTSPWSQFSPRLVAALHAGGLHACAWQYDYGSDPIGEAALAIRAVRAGADCLVIDAEAEYQGRYASAQVFLRTLRAAIGHTFPVGLASYPYADYHPGFPYSVLLGPGGAQFDLPQMYWKDINTTIDRVFAHTFLTNGIYARPIVPLGQTYGSPSAAEIGRFRALTLAYGAPGISWWDWAWTSFSAEWAAISALLTPPTGFTGPVRGGPLLSQGAKGDAVLWLQEHLARVLPSQRITGLFGPQTLGDLKAFQGHRGLTMTGQTDAATWSSLLALRPVTVDWAGSAARSSARRAPQGAGARVAEPASAALPAIAYETPQLGSDRHPPPHADPPGGGVSIAARTRSAVCRGRSTTCSQVRRSTR